MVLIVLPFAWRASAAGLARAAAPPAADAGAVGRAASRSSTRCRYTGAGIRPPALNVAAAAILTATAVRGAVVAAHCSACG
ncbi:MAG: hypothetical protein MZV49_02275 [Rhodopseudomonas palustris]|nr:hypothetical protein [Rhodopseudomonas palustris]